MIKFNHYNTIQKKKKVKVYEKPFSFKNSPCTYLKDYSTFLMKYDHPLLYDEEPCEKLELHIFWNKPSLKLMWCYCIICFNFIIIPLFALAYHPTLGIHEIYIDYSKKIFQTCICLPSLRFTLSCSPYKKVMQPWILIINIINLFVFVSKCLMIGLITFSTFEVFWTLMISLWFFGDPII